MESKKYEAPDLEIKYFETDRAIMAGSLSSPEIPDPFDGI